MGGKDFFPLCRLSLHIADSFLCWEKAFSLNLSQLLILAFISCAMAILLRKSDPGLTFWTFGPTFSSVRCRVSGLILRSLRHCELSFVQGERYGFHLILLHMDLQLSQHHLLNRQSFLHCIFLAPLSSMRILFLFGFVSVSSILYHWSTCLFWYQYHGVFVTIAF